jgi:phosphatidylinositol glycan class M
MWYLWFLPLVLPHLNVSRRKAVLLLGLWVGSQVRQYNVDKSPADVCAQAVWLSIAYRLEFLGSQVYLPLWTAGTAYVAVNSYVLAEVIRGYTFARERVQEAHSNDHVFVK